MFAMSCISDMAMLKSQFSFVYFIRFYNTLPMAILLSLNSMRVKSCIFTKLVWIVNLRCSVSIKIVTQIHLKRQHRTNINLCNFNKIIYIIYNI